MTPNSDFITAHVSVATAEKMLAFDGEQYVIFDSCCCYPPGTVYLTV